MTKQEEIREGFEDWLMGSQHREWDAKTLSGMALEYLHSQGVVLKVDRELPEDWYNDFLDKKRIEKVFEQAGYVAVEPLI